MFVYLADVILWRWQQLSPSMSVHVLPNVRHVQVALLSGRCLSQKHNASFEFVITKIFLGLLKTKLLYTHYLYTHAETGIFRGQAKRCWLRYISVWTGKLAFLGEYQWIYLVDKVILQNYKCRKFVSLQTLEYFLHWQFVSFNFLLSSSAILNCSQSLDRENKTKRKLYIYFKFFSFRDGS